MPAKLAPPTASALSRISPIRASPVAGYHALAGFSRRKINPSRATTMGEKPMATTVPTATPASSTPRKKKNWKPSRARVEGTTQRMGQRQNRGSSPRNAHQRSRARPPTSIRSAPMT